MFQTEVAGIFVLSATTFLFFYFVYLKFQDLPKETEKSLKFIATFHTLLLSRHSKRFLEGEKSFAYLESKITSLTN